MKALTTKFSEKKGTKEVTMETLVKIHIVRWFTVKVTHDVAFLKFNSFPNIFD